MVKVTFHGHSCFSLSADGHTVLIDPFIKNNPVCKIKPEDIKTDFVVVTHGHGDHWGDTPLVASKNMATVIANFELAEYAQRQGLKAHPLHIGGSAKFPFGWAKLTIAHHGSTLEHDQNYGGAATGVLVNIGGKTIYHAGDTGLFLDMKLIGEMNPIDLALLPIGDNFTMGPTDAAKAVEFLMPKKVVPMHYNTFDIIRQDPKEFAGLLKGKPTECIIMNPGDTIEF